MVCDRAGVRVLVISADVGESHAVMARALASDLERHADVADVQVLEDFSVLGSLLARVLPRGFDFHLGRVKWSYDLGYKLFARFDPGRRFGEVALYALGGRALASVVAHSRADVVVSTYPVMNPVLGRLRRAGRLACPAAAVVGPLGGVYFWAQPGLDLHLALYAEAVPEIDRLAGPGKAQTVRPLVGDEFLSAPGRSDARVALGLPVDRPIVLVSGGGWGAGDLAGAIDVCLRLPDAHVIAVTGRNEASRGALAERYSGDRRVTVLGFTTRMRDLLCAADAFVTATAGISCAEARLCGCPTVCYGFAIGHIRDNTAALERVGLARTAASQADLRRELAGALAGGRQPIPRVDELPTAAELVVALALSGAASQASGRLEEGGRRAAMFSRT